MANPYHDKQGKFSSGGSGRKGAAKGGGGKSSGKTFTVKFPKKPKDLESEQKQIFNDRKYAKMNAKTMGQIYKKDGSVGVWAKGGGTPAANKAIRDKEAASVRKIRKDTAAKAAKLGLKTRESKSVPSNNAKALAKGLTGKRRSSRKSS